MNNSQHQYSHLPQPLSNDDEEISAPRRSIHENEVDNDEPLPSDASISSSSVNSSSIRYIPTQIQKTRAVGLFALTVILLFADQNLMAPNLTAMARDFGFTDTQRDVKLGGDIALAFFVLGAPASYVVGILADSNRVKRVRLFALVVGLGEGACGMTFATTKYWQLYVCRAITGFSLGGALPLIYSILGDLYPADQRHLVSSLVGIGAGIGIAVGQGIAGYLGPTWGWRLPFLLVSIPAMLCALLVLLTVDEPERGGMEQVVRQAQHQHHHDPCRQEELDEQESTLFRSDYDQEQDDKEDASSVASDLRSTVELPPMEREEEPVHIPRPIKSAWPKSADNEPAISACSIAHRIEHDILLVNESPEFDLRRIENDDHCNALRTLLQTPTVILSLMQGGPGCIPWGIVNTYLNDYLAEDRGMSVEVSQMQFVV
ncbi:hypothetical protein MPSEU_001096000 [Mayamaea pseudoterrestris]|nr:hypothetical protein MPSEU_001096000 [Mayamaea pseudoterrestris]